MAHIDATVMAPGNKDADGFHVFGNVSSLVSDRTGTATMAGLVKALGGTITSQMRLSDLARELGNLLQGEPRCKVQTRWEGYAADFPAKEPGGKTGKTLVRGMRNFPERGGKYATTMEKVVEGVTYEVNAQAAIQKFLPA
jgi:hypothetical protein